MEFHEKLYQLRKEANLSQEQLAAMLNVSRQAVGKWENGSAFPDITNCIELSKIFHISLNELLQVEDMGENGNTFNLELLSQLKAKEKKQKRKNILFSLMGLLLILMIIIQNSRITNLQTQMMNQYNSLQFQIGNIPYRPSYNTESSLFEIVDITLGEPNYDTEIVSADIKVALKEYKDTTKLSLRINEEGKERIVEMEAKDTGIFEAKIDLSMKAMYTQIYGIIENEGLKKIEILQDFYDFKYRFYNELLFDNDLVVTSYSKAPALIQGSISYSIMGKNEYMYYTDLQIVYLKNNEVVFKENEEMSNYFAGGRMYMPKFEDDLEMPLEVEAIYHDNFGNEYIEKLCRIYKNEDGVVVENYAKEEFGVEVIN